MNAPRDVDALLDAARQWREYAGTVQNANLARACVDAARTLEMRANDGVARCSCCFKPLTGGMRL